MVTVCLLFHFNVIDILREVINYLMLKCALSALIMVRFYYYKADLCGRNQGAQPDSVSLLNSILGGLNWWLGGGGEGRFRSRVLSKITNRF